MNGRQKPSNAISSLLHRGGFPFLRTFYQRLFIVTHWPRHGRADRQRPPPGRRLWCIACPPREERFHRSAARLRCAGFCAPHFFLPSFAVSPRSEHVPPSLARLDLVRNSV